MACLRAYYRDAQDVLPLSFLPRFLPICWVFLAGHGSQHLRADVVDISCRRPDSAHASRRFRGGTTIQLLKRRFRHNRGRIRAIAGAPMKPRLSARLFPAKASQRALSFRRCAPGVIAGCAVQRLAGDQGRAAPGFRPPSVISVSPDLVLTNLTFTRRRAFSLGRPRRSERCRVLHNQVTW